MRERRVAREHSAGRPNTAPTSNTADNASRSAAPTPARARERVRVLRRADAARAYRAVRGRARVQGALMSRALRGRAVALLRLPVAIRRTTTDGTIGRATLRAVRRRVPRHVASPSHGNCRETASPPRSATARTRRAIARLQSRGRCASRTLLQRMISRIYLVLRSRCSRSKPPLSTGCSIMEHARIFWGVSSLWAQKFLAPRSYL